MFERCRKQHLHMIIRPENANSKGLNSVSNFLKKPVASRESTNKENRLLECESTCLWDTVINADLNRKMSSSLLELDRLDDARN